MQRITADLLDVLKGFDVPDSENNEVDSGLQQLVVECQNVATDLLKLLNSLHVDNQSKREAIKAAFKLMWKEEEILSFQKRLDQCRAQLIVHLLAILRYVQSQIQDEFSNQFNADWVISRHSSRSVHEQEIVLEKVESVLQVT